MEKRNNQVKTSLKEMYDYSEYGKDITDYNSYGEDYGSYILDIERKLNTNRNQYSAVLINENSCDKYDYLVAAACGSIGGLIDVFFVGTPIDSKLDKFTDKQIDELVKIFARKLGWKPQGKNTDNVKSAIGFLQNRFKVNYDQRKPSDVNSLFNIAPKTHHMMSLAHSPDIIGLFFSVLNQFTNTASFIADGKLVTVDTKTFELYGTTFITKILCGIINWFGHLMSDIAGSSGAHDRGIGIVLPFYELFGLCKFGNFSTANGKKDFAELMTAVFTNGYDFRHGISLALPLIVTEFTIKVVWAIRRRFAYGMPLNKCIPSTNNNRVRAMLLIGDGCLCIMDAVDAGVRAGGNWIAFFMRLNILAWFRFLSLTLKELCIKLGIKKRIKEISVVRDFDTTLLQVYDEDVLHGIESIYSEAEIRDYFLEDFDEWSMDNL